VARCALSCADAGLSCADVTVGPQRDTVVRACVPDVGTARGVGTEGASGHQRGALCAQEQVEPLNQKLLNFQTE
jgi:hypothetical protein